MNSSIFLLLTLLLFLSFSSSSLSSSHINSNSILVAFLDSHYNELAELVEKALPLHKLEDAVGNHNITIFSRRNLNSLQTPLMSHIIPTMIFSTLEHQNLFSLGFMAPYLLCMSIEQVSLGQNQVPNTSVKI
ncbi:hypothetical protein Lal_00026685, partial [Lupinus albus]